MLKTLVSGIQPTGTLHIGNYLGFVKTFVKLQNHSSDISRRVLLIADLHSLSLGYQDPKVLRLNILHTLTTLVACGIDPEKTILVQQSRLPEHTELMWILGSAATLPSLTSLPQFKDKSRMFPDASVPVGLVTYPLLQASDVLTYKATHVPVGDDQSQHMNIVRHLAKKFNVLTGQEYFPIPETISGDCVRLKSLRDPAIKMSKSDLDVRSRIDITDTSDATAEKIKKSVTDGEAKIAFDPENRPGVSNLIILYSLFSGLTVEQVLKEIDGINKVQFKARLAELINEELAPARQCFSQLIGRQDELMQILREGEERARPIAMDTLKETKKIVGLL